MDVRPENRARSCWRIIAVGVVAVILMCGGLRACLDADAERVMRTQFGFVAERGGVDATFEGVEAMMRNTFPRNMTRTEAMETLDATFGCYELYPLDPRTHEPVDNWYYVLFPGADCTCEEFHTPETWCRGVEYRFTFDGDRLLWVSLQAS
jgi:hypothetical protein